MYFHNFVHFTHPYPSQEGMKLLSTMTFLYRAYAKHKYDTEKNFFRGVISFFRGVILVIRYRKNQLSFKAQNDASPIFPICPERL